MASCARAALLGLVIKTVQVPPSAASPGAARAAGVSLAEGCGEPGTRFAPIPLRAPSARGVAIRMAEPEEGMVRGVMVAALVAPARAQAPSGGRRSRNAIERTRSDQERQ